MPNEQERARRREYMRAYRANQKDSCYKNEVESRFGRVVILASSFEGSARNMNEHYHDAMAIVAKYGFPELFITMTANTEWPEIIENLHQNQTAFERPDLIDRVFLKKKLKKKKTTRRKKAKRKDKEKTLTCFLSFIIFSFS